MVVSVIEKLKKLQHVGRVSLFYTVRNRIKPPVQLEPSGEQNDYTVRSLQRQIQNG